MKSSLERLSDQFTQLIGPEAFAKAAAAAAVAATAAAAAAAAKAAPAPAAPAAPKPATTAVAPAAATATSAVAKPAPSGVAGLAEPGSGSSTPATATNPAAAVASGIAAASVVPKPAAAAVVPATATATPTAAKPAVAAAVAPKPAPVAPPPPPSPLQATNPLLKGYNLDATVAPNQVVAAATLLDREGFGLDAVTGVDWLAQGEMEVVYDYFHPTESLRVVVRTRVPRSAPDVPTISNVFAGANWHERETHDFFGIQFVGHPNLKPFLLPEDATFHPLRKDYTP